MVDFICENFLNVIGLSPASEKRDRLMSHFSRLLDSCNIIIVSAKRTKYVIIYVKVEWIIIKSIKSEQMKLIVFFVQFLLQAQPPIRNG